MDNLRVFLVDDHPVVRAGLRALLSAEPEMEVVGEAADAETAVEQGRALQPDVVIMDVSLPKQDGGWATRQLKQACPKTKVLALTVHEERSYVQELLAAGASGYVLKRTVTEDLVRAVRTVAAGGLHLDPSVAGPVVRIFAAPPAAPAESLSPREGEVLRLIAEGYLHKEIAARLGVSVKTVETYRSRAMEKLGLESRVDIVRYAAQQGWLQAEGQG